MSESPHLTIAIPTYGRNEKLLASLTRLLPQLTTRERLLILDNCSPISVEQSIKPILSQYPKIDVKVYRNRANIGMAANIMRCFEFCETEWLWTLGDDDLPYENAIEIVRRDIQERSDYIFFNYASSMVEKGVSFAITERSKSFSTEGLNDFIRNFDSFANTIFISSGVYNVPLLLPNLKIGHIYSYSLAPHFATLLYSLGASNKAFFSTDKLVHFQLPDPADTWSSSNFFQSIPLLWELPMEMDDKTFQTLVDKTTRWFLDDKGIYGTTVWLYPHSPKKRRFVFVQFMARTCFLRRTLKQKLLLLIIWGKMFFPEALRSRRQKRPPATPLDRI